MLTDPEKMRLGLEQFASNPLLKVTHPNPNPNPNLAEGSVDLGSVRGLHQRGRLAQQQHVGVAEQCAHQAHDLGSGSGSGSGSGPGSGSGLG